MADSTTITTTLAEFAAASSFEKLPETVRDRAKQVIFDEIACSYFGRRSLAGDLTARYAEQAGGAGEARIYATGKRVSAPNAALANGAAGHGEEVDGAHVVGGHPGASIVHASTATAERQRATGADLINAVVLGYEIGVRVIDACGGLYTVKDRFGLNSDFLHALGCSVASSRLLGLDPLRHNHAMALASFGSNALVAFYSEKRHVSKSLCNGMHAFAGVTGALMASVGLEGHEDILGGPYGVLHAWGADGGRERIVEGLGETHAIMGANFKFLNAGYPIHSPVEAALTLISQHNIDITSIESIYVGIPTTSFNVVNSRTMHNICLQDMLAAAIVKGGLKLRELPFPDVLSDPNFTRIRPLVDFKGDPDMDRDQPRGRGAIVSIKTAGADAVSMRVEHPKGHSLRGGPTWQELEEKWREGLPECDVGRMIALAQRLEDVEDVSEFLNAFQAQ